MKRLAWLTDPHLNFLAPEAVEAFCAELARTEADAVAISGDIGEAPDVDLYLNTLDTHLGRPVFFVLGNHDFYRSSIPLVRAKMAELCAACPRLHYLPAAGIVELTEKACLVGHDGWADGRHGDYWSSDVVLSDWRLIHELVGLEHEELLEQLQRLGDEAAAHFRTVLPEALARFEHVYVLTHVPPFPEGCTWEGRITTSSWLPHVCCKAVGDVLVEVMAPRRDRTLTVLCGHTHQPADVLVAPNIRIITGAAEYRHPGLQRVFEIE